MLRKILNIKVILTLVFTTMVAMSFASFSSTNTYRDDDKDKNKKKDRTEMLSLKNMQRPDAFFSLSSISSSSGDQNSLSNIGRFRFVNPDDYTDNTPVSGSSVKVNSSIRVTTGNQVVVYPYSYKLKPAPFSIFKTPTGR
ncbi:MAG TPA: hypothetical protein VL053_09260 [Arachidicoccus sp.]|nr:hypothetical protein [Arachidicoccus sp.]